MTESLWPLAISSALFVSLHLLLAAPLLRGPIVGAIGEWAFRGVFSSVSLLLLVWMVAAFGYAPSIDVWLPPIACRHVAVSLMPIATILVVAGLTAPNPTLIGMDSDAIAARPPAGIFTVTRHPVLAGIALWAFVHLLANGDAASMILFGGMLVLSLAGVWSLDAKKRRSERAGDWAAYTGATSFLPFAAAVAGQVAVDWKGIGWWRPALGIGLYAGLLGLHARLFGASPLPL